MTEVGAESFEDKLLARLAKEGKSIADVHMPGEKPKPSPIEDEYADDIPDIGDIELSDEEQAIDDAIKNLSIIDAYNKWAGKGSVKVRSGIKESIKVRCPDPHHKDVEPSAWINTDKNVYHCGGCEVGGDVWYIAAFHFGFPVPGFKDDAQMFRELREKMALDLGFSITKSFDGSHVYTVAEEPPRVEVKTEPRDFADFYKYNGPTIDWQGIVPPQTFLWDWMQATTQDNSPEEYHFWTGLMALGYAIGREVTLADEPEVVGNLFVCLVGPTSVGKSKAKRHLRVIVEEVLPRREDDPLSTGTKMIGAPGSGEYMVQAFSEPIRDPADPKKILAMAPVRGYIDYEEFATLAAMSGRMGSTLKQTLLDIYDAQSAIVSGSLTHGKRSATKPYGQVISSTQPDAMSKLMSKDDDISGFINRWVFAMGKPKRVQAWGGVRVDLSDAKVSLKRIHVWGSRRIQVEMSPEAIAIWEQFFYDTLMPMKLAAEKKNTGVLGRIDLVLKKIILLMAANKLEKIVSEDTVHRALDLFPYLIGTSGHTEKRIKRTDDGDLNMLIVEQIERLTEKNGVNPTKRDLYLACKSRIKTDDQMVRVLKNMISLELVTETQYKPKTGRPTIRYSVGAPEEKSE